MKAHCDDLRSVVLAAGCRPLDAAGAARRDERRAHRIPEGTVTMRIGLMHGDDGIADARAADPADRRRREGRLRHGMVRPDHGRRLAHDHRARRAAHIAHRVRHGRDPDVPAASVRDGAAGADGAGGDERPLHAGHRPIARTSSSRTCGACRTRSPPVTCASTCRCSLPLLRERPRVVQRRGLPRQRRHRRRRSTARRPVIISALAPLMLKLAGTMTDGTVTWMTGAEDDRDARRAGRQRGREGGRTPGAARRRRPARLRHR